MEIRKIIFSVLFLILSLGVFAQKHPVFYTGIDFYRQGSFAANYFENFNVGAQVYQFKFFAPEIGYSAFLGILPEQEILNMDSNSAYPDALFKQSFSSSVLSLSPKLKFGKEDAFLIISPTYHIGSVFTRASYFTPAPNNNGAFIKSKIEKEKSQISYWSFAVGFEGIYISPHFWFGIKLNYIQLHIQQYWEDLDFSEYDIKADTPGTTTIGFGLRIYYDPFANDND